jgi:type II secretory pathway pseudopilin PulG
MLFKRNNKESTKLINKIFSFKSFLGANKPDSEAGFTLIELLVSALIGTLLISTLLSFLLGILESDRRETAKSNTQQDIQAALKYISDDIEEAIYIYDGDGLQAISNQIPYGSASSIPARDNKNQPVLAFWRRTYYAYDQQDKYTFPVTDSAGTLSPLKRRVGCLGRQSNLNCNGTGEFVYSLVVYYTTKEFNSGVDTWSNSSRLRRWEIRDGITGDRCLEPPTNIAFCPPFASLTLGDSPRKYYTRPSQGFAPFIPPSTGIKLRDVMNGWKKGTAAYEIGETDPLLTGNAPGSPLETLLDFVDDTQYTTLIDDSNPSNFPIAVPIRPNAEATFPTSTVNVTINGVPVPKRVNTDCVELAGTGAGSQRVPSAFNTPIQNNDTQSAFYACVNSPAQLVDGDPNVPIARVYLRGNAFVRFKDVQLSQRTFISPFSGSDLGIGTSLFPTSSVLVTGKGLISN